MERLPYRLIIGPLSPLFDPAEKTILSSLALTHPQCLGDYLYHPDIVPFYMHPESLNLGHDVACVFPQTDSEPLFFGGPAGSSIQALVKKLPVSTVPQILIWWGLHYMLPWDLGSCSLPTAMIVSDWHYHFELLQKYVSEVDYLLCDRHLLAQLHAQGARADYWPSYSFNPDTYRDLPQETRDIDVCFMGNINPAHYAERNRWIQRLCRLGDRYPIKIAHQVLSPDYERTLNRSKLVLDHVVTSGMSLRTYEATAAGALLLMDENNREIRDFLPADGPQQACVLYGESNFEDLIHYYLSHDAQRQEIAERGQRRIQHYTYQKQFQTLLDKIPQILTQIRAYSGRISLKRPLSDRESLLGRMHQALTLQLSHIQPEMQKELDALSEQELLRDPHLLNALVVYAANQITPLEASSIKHVWSSSRLLPLLQQSIQQNPLIPSLNNLCWFAFQMQELDVLRESLALFFKALAQPSSYDVAIPVLSIRLTSLYVLRQQAFFKQAQDPAQLQITLFRLMAWSALFLHANLDLMQGQKTHLLRAMTSLKDACQLVPEMAEGWLDLGRCYALVGQFPEAIEALEKGIEIGVYYGNAWILLIEIFVQLKQTENAHKRIQEARILFQDKQFYAEMQTRLDHLSSLLYA